MLEATPMSMVKCEDVDTRVGVYCQKSPRQFLEEAASLAEYFSFPRVKSESEYVIIGKVNQTQWNPPKDSSSYFMVDVERCYKGDLEAEIKISWIDLSNEMIYLPYYRPYEGRRYLLCLGRFEDGFLPTCGRWSVFMLAEDRVMTWTGHDLGKFPDYFGGELD